MSSTSLALSPSPQSTLREKLSFNRFRSRTPSNAAERHDPTDFRVQYHYQNPLKAQSPGSIMSPSSPTESEFIRPDSRPSFPEPASPHTPLHLQEYHPYANPDLATGYPDEPPSSRRLEELHALAHSEPHSPVVRSESTATITESSTVTTLSTMSQSKSQASVLTPGTSVSSFPKLATFSKNGKAAMDAASIRSGASDDSEGQEVTVTPYSQHTLPSPSIFTPSWPRSPNPRPIKLISLEEAQAQVRERSRSATTTATMASQSVRTPDPNVTQSTMSWTRLRSTSGSSSKIKSPASASTTDLHSTLTLPSSSSLAGANGAPQRVIARKKSGFMRLFNSKDKMSSSPPPVPSISADMIAPVPTIVTPISPANPARPRKQSSHYRVPVPSITPSLLAESETGSGSSHDSHTEGPSTIPENPDATPRERQLSARRNVPGLFILTSSSPAHNTGLRPSPPLATMGSQSGALPTPKSTTGEYSMKDFLSSEDPKSSRFVGLSLRPVSASFGPEFVGRINDNDEYPRPSLETDTGTPTTNTSAISPRSPSPIFKSDPLGTVDVADVEDQSSVIRALQEQMVTARKAWQMQLWELEGQVNDLKKEVEELHAKERGQEYCSTCGRGGAAEGVRLEELKRVGAKIGGVVNRPRARTGVGSRFASGT
jgi:hypothetical protein